MNILFTCAGRRTYLLNYFKENLSEGDAIVAADKQLSAPALQVADVKLQVPEVYDSHYVGILLEICKQYQIDVLISQKKEVMEDVEKYKRSLIYETVTGKRKVV